MDLIEKIDEDMKKALKAGEKIRLQVLRQLKSVIKNAEIAKQGVLQEKDVLQVIKTELKKRKESFESFVAGKREELAEQEKKEANVLSEYMPEQISEEQVDAIVKAKAEELGVTDKKGFGKLMGAVIKETGLKADGDIVKARVERYLN